MVMARWPSHRWPVAASGARRAGAVSAHDIPNDVTVQAFVKPEGQRAAAAGARAAQGDARHRLPDCAAPDTARPRRAPTPIAARRRDALDGRLHRPVRGRRRALGARRGRRGPRVAASPTGRSRSYDEALAHVTGPPLPADTELVWNQGLLDVLFEYPIQSDRSRVLDRAAARAARPAHGDRAALPAAGRRRARLRVPRRSRASCGSIRAGIRRRCGSCKLGFCHILDGTDHLLFLFCLVIPFRRFRALVADRHGVHASRTRSR